jgi:predicted nucleic acid-binding Zn ribbon protein
MPLYMYRREDGTTFEIRQKFLDEPLSVDPETGQSVVRVVQAAGIIFKGSGFYVNDSKSKSSSTINSKSNGKESSSEAASTTAETPSSETKTEAKSETKAETKSEAKSESKASSTPKTAAAD